MWVLLCLALSSAPSLTSELSWPLPHGKILTGGHADSRPDHFHGGVDLRTGPEPREVVAPTDGFVERIAVNPSGYGRTIYFRMSDDRTAVFGHLSRFVPPLEKILRDSQLVQGTYRVDFAPDSLSSAMHFRRGEILCYTGQTGMGPPHLHFEIREGAVQTDPLASFSPEDKQSPVVTSLRWIGASEYTPWSSGNPLALTKVSSTENRAPTVRTNEPVAFFIACYDPGPWGRNAVPARIRVEADGQTVFDVSPARIDLLGPRDIYEQLVYAEYVADRDVRRLFKSIPTPTPAQLPPGWISDAAPVRIIVTDRSGNEATVSLNVETTASSRLVSGKPYVSHQTSDFSLNSSDDASASWVSLTQSGENQVSISPPDVAFGDRLRLNYKLNGRSFENQYFYSVRSNGSRRSIWRIPESADTTVVSCYILKAGTYGVGFDATPPKLLLSSRNGRIHFKLTDEASDIDDTSIRCMVNGQIAIPEFEYEEDGGYIWTQSTLKRGKQQVDFTAADRAGNEKSWTVSVTIP